MKSVQLKYAISVLHRHVDYLCVPNSIFDNQFGFTKTGKIYRQARSTEQNRIMLIFFSIFNIHLILKSSQELHHRTSLIVSLDIFCTHRTRSGHKDCWLDISDNFITIKRKI